MTQAVQAPAAVDLDGIADTIKSYQSASEHIKALQKNLEEWKEHQGKLKAVILAAMNGSPAGKLNGREVVSYEARDQFAHARFIKENPDLAQVFMVKKVTDELDWHSLLAAEPDIAAPYHTKVFKVDL